MKWEDISKHLPGRSAISCRLRFQNYLERRSEWDDEKKNKLARLYERFVSFLMPNDGSFACTKKDPDCGTDSRRICGRRSPKRWLYPGGLQKPCIGKLAK